MTSTTKAGRFWPNREQELLLEAAVGAGSAAISAYRGWQESVDLEDHLDEGSFNLLPMVYANMAGLGIRDQLMPRLKGVYRNSWVRAAHRSAMARELLSLLVDADIPVMVAKGLPLALDFYASPALRPMNDLDLIVPKHKTREASYLLARHGFCPVRADWDDELPIRHSIMHVHSEQGEVDLHWHVLFECLNEEADEFFWNEAVPLDVSGTRILRPCATDMLVHVLVHGLRWNLSPPMRWVADAVTILRGPEQVDWQRLADFARRHRLSRRIRLGLLYLRDRYGMAVPPEALAALSGSSLVERFEIFAMQGEDERSHFRHLRRAAHVLRLATSEPRVGLPRVIGNELLKRYGPRRSKLPPDSTFQPAGLGRR